MDCVQEDAEDVVVGIGIGGEYPTGSVAVGLKFSRQDWTETDE